MSSQATPESGTKLSYRRFKDGDHGHGPWAEQIFQASHTFKCPTYQKSTPPCQASCPSGEDIRGYLAIVRGTEKPPAGPNGQMSWQEYAWRRLTEANPFPSVMGRVCPAPCESGCNRNEVEDFVGINSVEHFLGDWALEHGLKFGRPAAATGKKIAVIGGGPAGLSCAYQLALKGHAVTIFDEHQELGGMMRYGIPGFRTPRAVLDAEIGRIDASIRTIRDGRLIGRLLADDRHATLREYAAAKARVFANQGPGDWTVVNADDLVRAIVNFAAQRRQQKQISSVKSQTLNHAVRL